MRGAGYEQARERLLLAAGGTGGHIYPAVALAEALQETAPEVEVQFCCGNRPTELQIYRRLGIAPWILPVSHHRPGLMREFNFARLMVAAFSRAWRMLGRNPVRLAMGFGGYVSAPPLVAAWMRGSRVALHEQNVQPGVANRMLAPLAQLIAAGPSELRGRGLPAGKLRHVGNPVRPSILKPVDRAEARAFFRLGQDRPVCLCLGGSQGAAGVNRITLELLGRMQDLDSQVSRWQLLWSTGAANYEMACRALGHLGVDPREHSVNPYIGEMAMAYAAADVVVTRAGALTLAELTSLGRPAVLVPLPSAAGGHQAHNARWLERHGAAEVIEEADPHASERLEQLLIGWMNEPERLAAMAAAARSLGRPNAAYDLARVVLGMLRSGG